VAVPRRLARVLTEAEAGRRLDDLLGAWLSEELGGATAIPTAGATDGAPDPPTGGALSKSAVRRLIMAGAVSVGGRPLRRPGFVLSAGDRVEARVQADRLVRPRDLAFVIGAAQVLFEDDWLIAVDKPAGIATVPTADPSRPHVVGAVSSYLGSAYVGVHQRLDRETSGVVLFTKDAAANPALARAFAAREVHKTYHALVGRPVARKAAQRRGAAGTTARGPAAVAAAPGAGLGAAVGAGGGAGDVPPEWINRDPIGGQSAETAFKRLDDAFPSALLLEAQPRTGRKHQIRVHLASAGMPIVGDERYGGPRAPRLMLHAASLRLPHPRTGAELRIDSPYPDDFRRVLDSARRR